MLYSDEYKPENYRYIGKTNVPRKDAREIVTGKCVFLDDFTLPRTLIGKSLKSPYAHALVKEIDAEKARALKGVAAVITYKEADPDWKLGWPPQKSIIDRKLRYAGDTVAIVAAETAEIAKAALDLIEVEYDVLPSVIDGISAVKEGAPQLYEEFQNNIVPPGYPPFQKDGPFWQLFKGDVEKAFEECAFVAEDTVEFAKMASPLAPEQPGAIVRWDGGDDYTVWATSQSSYICKIFNSAVIPNSNLDICTFNVGGSYGNKQSIGIPVVLAAMLSRATGRPVKFYQTKTEQLTSFETRLGSQVHAKIGMDKDGVVKAVKADWFVDTGAFCNGTQAQIGVGIGETQLVMAKCPNWRLDTNCVVTNKQPAGIVRGFGGQELNSCLALLMGRTMKAGNLDPVECFKKNYVNDGDFFTWRDGREWRAHSINYVPAMEAAAKKFGWKEKWKGWGVPTWTSEDGNRVRGVGCGVIGNADIGEDNTEAYVRVVPDLMGEKSHVILQTSVTESGMGQRSNLAKMVAEIMNIPYEHVDVTPTSTKINPTGFGLCGSRGTITYGHAISNACEDVKKKLCQLAVPFLEVEADAMELRDYGVGCVARPSKFVTWKKLIPPDLTLTGYGQHLENFSTPNFMMVFLEVEVNKETGLVSVIKWLSGADAGQIIDPAALEMQLQGGIGAACLDTATYEEHIIDPVLKRTLTYNMIEYKWRPFNEFPAFDSVVLESQFDTFQFKAVGLGEISGAAAASATLQAVSNAIGVQVSQYPATPDVILKALGRM